MSLSVLYANRRSGTQAASAPTSGTSAPQIPVGSTNYGYSSPPAPPPQYDKSPAQPTSPRMSTHVMPQQGMAPPMMRSGPAQPPPGYGQGEPVITNGQEVFEPGGRFYNPNAPTFRSGLGLNGENYTPPPPMNFNRNTQSFMPIDAGFNTGRSYPPGWTGTGNSPGYNGPGQGIMGGPAVGPGANQGMGKGGGMQRPQQSMQSPAGQSRSMNMRRSMDQRETGNMGPQNSYQPPGKGGGGQSQMRPMSQGGKGGVG